MLGRSGAGGRANRTGLQVAGFNRRGNGEATGRPRAEGSDGRWPAPCSGLAAAALALLPGRSWVWENGPNGEVEQALMPNQIPHSGYPWVIPGQRESTKEVDRK